MAYLRIKKIRGREYLYLVTKVKVDGKVKRTEKYEGPATEDQKLALLAIQRANKEQRKFKSNFDQLWLEMAERAGQDPKKMRGMSGLKNTHILRSIVQMNSWLTSVGFRPDQSKSGRILAKHPRGSMNPTMIYHLSTIKNEKQRLELFKFIKLRKFRLAIDVEELVKETLAVNLEGRILLCPGPWTEK